MKRTKFYLLASLILLIAGFSVSCSSDDSTNDFSDADIQDTLPDITPPLPAELASLRSDALDDLMQTVSFDAEDGIDYTTEKGTHIYIPPNCLTLNADPAEGEVTMEVVEIYNRKNMVSTNKPVMGLKPNGDKAMLISGGEFYVTVTQDGQQLDSGCQYQFRVLGDLTGGVDPEMVLWEGMIDDDGNLTWDEVDPGDNGANNIFSEAGIYYAWRDDFGWTNIDRFGNYDGEKTTMLVSAPEGFDNQNSAVYLSYDGEENALAQLDTYLEDDELFSEHYGQIPVGLDVHIIFVSADGDNWRYAIKGVTITPDETYHFSLDDTQLGSTGELEAAIEDLP